MCDLLALTGTESVEEWVTVQIASHTDRKVVLLVFYSYSDHFSEPYLLSLLLDLDIEPSPRLYDIGIQALQTIGLERSGFEILRKFKNPELPAQVVEFACSRDDIDVIKVHQLIS